MHKCQKKVSIALEAMLRAIIIICTVKKCYFSTTFYHCKCLNCKIVLQECVKFTLTKLIKFQLSNNSFCRKNIRRNSLIVFFSHQLRIRNQRVFIVTGYKKILIFFGYRFINNNNKIMELSSLELFHWMGS